MAMKLPTSSVRQLSSFLTKHNIMDHSTLVLTQILFRHGHRSPDQAINYPNDPYQDETYMPFGKGELTLTGRKQSYTFGIKLRERYANFLGSEYYHGIVDAKSSEVSRARTTLQLVLAGLFPPSLDMKIDDSLNWHPVPYSYAPLKEDPLIGKAIRNMYNHEDHPDFGLSENCQEVVKCIEEHLQWEVKKQAQCFLIFDTIKTQISFGLKMPEWCKEIYPEKLKKEVQEFVRHNFSKKEFLVNGHGAMLKEFNDVMWQKVKEIEKEKENGDNFPLHCQMMPKMFLYSGHDINLVGVLSCFGHFDPAKWPKYVANLILELHRVDHKYYVMMIFQDGQCDSSKEYCEAKREVLKIPNCDNDMCTLSEFAQHVKPFFPIISSNI